MSAKKHDLFIALSGGALCIPINGDTKPYDDALRSAIEGCMSKNADGLHVMASTDGSPGATIRISRISGWVFRERLDGPPASHNPLADEFMREMLKKMRERPPGDEWRGEG